jgi:hypothetical protein
MFMHALIPGSSSSVFPSVTDKSTQNALAFSVDGATDTAQFVLQKRSRDLEMGQMQSDGIFVWTDYSGTALNHWFVNEATYFDWGGKRILESQYPLTFTADFSASGLQVFHIEHVLNSTTMTLRDLWPLDSIEAVELDHMPLPFSTAPDGGVTFAIPYGGILRVHADAATNMADDVSARPLEFGLEANYPNPFNPSTVLRFRLPSSAYTVLAVYNSIGQKVLVLFEGNAGPGLYERVWDGKTEQGAVAASGLYLFELRSGSHIERKKGLLVK